jgi:hypothetical protein
MAVKTQEIRAKLTGDNTDLVSSLEDARREIKKTARDAAASARESGGKLNDALAGVGTWALDKTIESVGRAMEYTRQQIQNLASIGDAAAKNGLNPELYQRLSAVAEASGISIKDAAEHFRRWEAVLLSARSGNKEAILQLQAIGTSVEMLQGLNPWEAFTKAIPEAENLQKNLGYIFGKKAAGNANFIKFIETAKHASATVYSDEAIESAVKYQQAIKDLNRAFNKFITESGLVNWLTNQLEGLQALINPPDSGDAGQPSEAGALLNQRAELKDIIATADKDARIAQIQAEIERIKGAALAGTTMVPDVMGGVAFQPGRELTAEEHAAIAEHERIIGLLRMSDDELQRMLEEVESKRAELKAARAEQRAAEAAAKSPDAAIKAANDLAEIQREKQAAAAATAAANAARMRRMTPAQRLEAARNAAVEALQKTNPSLTDAQAARQVLTDEATAFSAGKLPKTWEDANIKSSIPMEQAAQRLLKAAEKIDDGFFVKKRN